LATVRNADNKWRFETEDKAKLMGGSRRKRILLLGEALGAFSIAPASGTHEQDKEKVYERPQF
jgi:hypothetical protein